MIMMNVIIYIKLNQCKYQILNYEHGLDELTGRGRVDWGIEQAASGRWTDGIFEL